MAGNSIRLDYQGMEEASKGLRAERDEFDRCIQKMTQIVNSLPDVWEGVTSEKYVDQFADLTPGFEATRDLIDDIATQIDSIVSTVQDTDEGMASQVGVK